MYVRGRASRFMWDVAHVVGCTKYIKPTYYNVHLVKSLWIILELFYDLFFLFVVCIQDHRCDI